MPSMRAAFLSSSVTTPGPATAMPSTGSRNSIVLRPAVLRTMQPSVATEAPFRPVRAPCGTTGTRCSWAYRMTSTTSATSRARTTSKSLGAVASKLEWIPRVRLTSASVTRARAAGKGWGAGGGGSRRRHAAILHRGTTRGSLTLPRSRRLGARSCPQTRRAGHASVGVRSRPRVGEQRVRDGSGRAAAGPAPVGRLGAQTFEPSSAASLRKNGILRRWGAQ